MPHINPKQVGHRITVKEEYDDGVITAKATIVEVTDWGYYVHIDGDDPEWTGPVDFEGNILVEF